MPSHFQTKSLKTKKTDTWEVSHFFVGRVAQGSCKGGTEMPQVFPTECVVNT